MPQAKWITYSSKFGCYRVSPWPWDLVINCCETNEIGKEIEDTFEYVRRGS